MAKFTVLLFCLAYVHLSEQAYLTPNAVEGEYNVELLVVVDPKAQAPYLAENGNSKIKADESILADLNYFLTEVNKLYANFYITGLKVSVRKVILLDTDFMASKSTDGKTVHGSVTLTDFDAYLADTGAKELYNYDHAVFFSGYDFLNDAGGAEVAGLAHVGQVCQTKKASSIVEYSGGYHTVIVAAHEIGHNLGAEHDSSTSAYVMAPSNTASGDRWRFSVCTASNVWETLRTLDTANNNCLLKTSTDSVVPNSPVTEKLADPNTVCKRAMGEESYYYFGSMKSLTNYEGTGNPKGDLLCDKIPCIDPARTVGLYVGTEKKYSSDGMACGVSKACDEGKCVSSTSAAAIKVTNADCMFGDLEKVNGGATGRVTCQEKRDQDLATFCSNTDLVNECCETYPVACAAGADACYGDVAIVYKGMSCTASLANLGFATFCNSPNIFEGKCCETWPATCPGADGCYVDEIEMGVFNGMSCAAALETYKAVTFCRYPQYFEKCCTTWAATCPVTRKRSLVDQLIGKLEKLVARQAGEEVADEAQTLVADEPQKLDPSLATNPQDTESEVSVDVNEALTTEAPVVDLVEA